MEDVERENFVTLQRLELRPLGRYTDVKIMISYGFKLTIASHTANTEQGRIDGETVGSNAEAEHGGRRLVTIPTELPLY
jgi:hypothetical protein